MIKSLLLIILFFYNELNIFAQTTIPSNPIEDVINFTKRKFKKSEEKYKWSIGTYAMPCYLIYSEAQPKTNFNILAGMQINKILFSNLSFSTGLFYYRNNLIGDRSDCYICDHNKSNGTIHNDFVVLPVGLKYRLSSDSSKVKVYITTGFMASTALFTKENVTDTSGLEHILFNRHRSPNLQPYIGLSFHWDLNPSSFLIIDSIYSAQGAAFDFGVSSISYRKLFGLGLGVGLKF